MSKFVLFILVFSMPLFVEAYDVPKIKTPTTPTLSKTQTPTGDSTTLQPPSSSTNDYPSLAEWWFQGAKGYYEAIEIQKQTGKDILFYISKSRPKDEKGLCRWWEKRGINTGPVQDAFRHFIKVRFIFPSDEEEAAIAKKYYPRKGPTLVVIPPEGRPQKVNIFIWVNRQPKLRVADEIAEDIMSYLSPQNKPPVK